MNNPGAIAVMLAGMLAGLLLCRAESQAAVTPPAADTVCAAPGASLAARRMADFEVQLETYRELAAVVGQIDAEAAFIADLAARDPLNSPAAAAFVAQAEQVRQSRLKAAVDRIDIDALAGVPGGSGLLADIAMQSTDPDLLDAIVSRIAIEAAAGRFHPLYFQTLERRLVRVRESRIEAPTGAVTGPRSPWSAFDRYRDTRDVIGRVAGVDDWSRDLIMGYLRADWTCAEARSEFEVAAGDHILSNIDEPNAEAVLSAFAETEFSELHSVAPSLTTRGVSVLQHAGSTEEMEDILRQIEPLALAGQFDGQIYALLYDRVALRSQSPQRFGSQIVCEDGDHEVYKLELPERVDDRREELGLRPLAQYLSIYRENAPPCEP